MLLDFCARCGVPLGKVAPCSCEACGEQFWDNPRPCGGAFVTDGDRLLLVQRRHEPWAGHWDVPGGFCDGDEHPEATTVRELREETGLEIRLTGLLGMWVDRYGDASTPSTLNIYFHAVTDTPASATVHDDEIAAVRWFGVEELPGLALAFPAHMRAAMDAWLSSR